MNKPLPSIHHAYSYIPRVFSPDYKISPLEIDEELDDKKSYSVHTVLSIPSVAISPKKAMKMQSLRDRRELTELIEQKKLAGVDVLVQISKYKSNYSKLVASAAEELSLLNLNSRSQKIDDLEREAALNSAKMEVEIQQQQEKLIRLKNEKTELNEGIKKNTVKLSKLNSDVQMLQTLNDQHGMNEEKPVIAKKEIDITQNKKEKPSPSLNDADYKRLWGERQELLDKIDLLQEQLKSVQEKQMEVFQEHAKSLIIKPTRPGK